MTVSKLLLLLFMFCWLATLSIPFTVVFGRHGDVLLAVARAGASFSVSGDRLLINVSDYSGETDGERIQKALNDVPPEGAIVFIPAGTWEACNLTAFSNTIVTGDNGTIMKRPANTTAPFITFENRTGFAVTSLVFDGQNVSEAAGVLVMNSTDFQIANDTFQDVARNAIHVCGASTDFVVENNLLVNTNVASILLFGTPGDRIIRRFLIANNTLVDSTVNGKIGAAFSADGTIAENYVYGCEFGIATRCVTNITIRDNRIENCTSYGIYLGTQIADYGSSGIRIFGNLVLGCNIGIARYYGNWPVDDVTVGNNTFLDNAVADVYADFQAAFFNNTVTSKATVRLLAVPTAFVGNVDVNSTLIIPADVTEDGKVDLRDIGIVARLYGLNQNSPGWNPKADIIQDGMIDMRDIGFAAKCFGFPYS